MTNSADDNQIDNGFKVDVVDFASEPTKQSKLRTKLKARTRLFNLQQRLYESEAQLSAIFKQSPIAIVYTNMDFQLSKTNSQFLKQYGYKQGEVSVLSELCCRSYTDKLNLENNFREQLISTGSIDCEIQLTHSNGYLGWTQLRGILINQLSNPQVVWSLEDISHKKSPQENAKLAATVYQVSSAAIMILDTDHIILNINPAFTDITGFTLIEIEGEPMNYIFDLPFNHIAHQEIISAINKEGYWRGELFIYRKTSDQFPAMVLINCIKSFGNNISHYVVLFLDISDHKQLENELRYHAEIDPLTRLPNRKLLFQRLESAFASAKRFNYHVALLYLDLDGFKQINDDLGHGQGDDVLIEVAQRLTCCVREVDTAARLGGDEFVVILNGTSKEMISDTAQRIIDSLTLTVKQEDIERQVSASIGIAIYPKDSTNPHTLLKYADEAMYKAKYKGKRQFCWHGNISN